MLEVRDGVTALDLVRTHRPSVAVLDVQMPQLDEFEVCRLIKGDLALNATLVLLLTSRAQQVDKQRGSSVSADAYLTKPFSPLELMELAEQHAQVPPEA